MYHVDEIFIILYIHALAWQSKTIKRSPGALIAPKQAPYYARMAELSWDGIIRIMNLPCVMYIYIYTYIYICIMYTIDIYIYIYTYIYREREKCIF